MFFTRKPPSEKLTIPSSGAMAEDHAEIFLKQQGLVIVAKNYRCKSGEIDLIMQHADTLVFVEVRLRTHQAFAGAAESVTIRKQQKIIKTAQYYLQQYQLTDKANCRFDVVAFGENGTPEWIKNAFSAY
ncbi:MAG: YraN family protein [Gammaproteobacteria bacterium]|nr:MAG: YraN family protein [Gammaproteobacteria bacterium]